MINKIQTTHKRRLSKTTIMSIRNALRKSNDLELEDFIYRIAMNYIAEVRDTDYVEEEDYVCIKDTNFECTCPYCGERISLDLKELSNE